MARRKDPSIPDALLDQLLAGADPKTAFDPGGLLDGLKKALAERALNAEMDHHLSGPVVPFYAFPEDVRKMVYTTNAIEALNSKLRRAVRARGHVPTDDAALKLLFLVLNRFEKAGKMPPREWAMAKAQFAVLFGERFTRAMA